MQITPLIASHFRSDGGTMFGLVPRTIWAERLPPDNRNCIAQHAHALLVRTDDGKLGLVDTGCGPASGFSDKEIALSGLGPGWPLMEQLQSAGVAAGEIDFIVFTHLHWDHAGGAMGMLDPSSEPAFSRAQLFIHEVEWTDALSRDPLLYKSYPLAIMEALAGARARVQLVSDRRPEIAPGLRLIRSSGHTRGHCMVDFQGSPLRLIHPQASSLGEVKWAVFAGDVCPTRHHLRMVFQTSYDTFPLDTRRWKREWLPRLASEGGLLLYDHDPDIFGSRIAADAKAEFKTVESLSATV